MISSSWDPFAARFITLHARLSPEECTRRLQKVTLPWISSLLVYPLVWSTLPLLGWVFATGFVVRKRAVPATGLQPEAKVGLVADPRRSGLLGDLSQADARGGRRRRTTRPVKSSVLGPDSRSSR